MHLRPYCIQPTICILEEIEKLKYGIEILVGQAVLELLIKTIFCTKLKNRVAYIEILMPILRFFDNLLQDAYISFPNSVDNLEIAH